MADTGYPNFLTIDPVTGAIGADFSGHIHAEGLDLDAGTTTTPPDTDRVRWLRQSDSAAVAYLTAYDVPSALPGDDTLESWCQAVPGGVAGGAAQAAIGVKASNGDRAMVYMTHNPQIVRKRSVRAFAEDDAGTQFDKLLIDSVGRADFPQLVTTGQIAIDFGKATLTWGGGNRYSAAISIAHNLGRVPLAVVFGPSRVAAAQSLGVNYIPPLTNTNINNVFGNVLEGTNPVAGTTAEVGWVAIG